MEDLIGSILSSEVATYCTTCTCLETSGRIGHEKWMGLTLGWSGTLKSKVRGHDADIEVLSEGTVGAGSLVQEVKRLINL